MLRFRWAILLFTALIAALSVAYVQTVQPLFRATNVLLLESKTAGVAAVQDLVIESGQEDEGYVATEIERLRSEAHAFSVLDSLALFDEPAFLHGVAATSGMPFDDIVAVLAAARTRSGEARLLDSVDEANSAMDSAIDSNSRSLLTEPKSSDQALIQRFALNHLLSRLTVEPVPTTRLIRIAYLSSDPELAARVANAFALQYVRGMIESERNVTNEVSDWLETRLDKLKRTLDESERAVREFKVENDLVGIGGDVGSLTEQRLVGRTQQLSEARLELASLGFLRDELESADNSAELLASVPASRIDPLLQETRAEISRLQQELDGLSNQYGPRHPRVVDTRSRIDVLNESLGASLNGEVNRVRNEYALAARRVAAIEEDLASERSTLQNVDSKTAELIALESKVQTNRDLYYRFFSRLSEARSTANLDPVHATVVQSAEPAIRPAKPNKQFVIALSTLGALVLSMLAALLVSAFDDSIRQPADVEQKLGQRLLGIVPVYRRSLKGISLWLPWRRRLAEQQNRIFNEAYRSLRTRLVLSGDADDRRVLLVTSSVPGEGKSVSAVCLARSFAQIERVLLIDADVRRPSLEQALALPAGSPGLTQLISGRAELLDCIQHHRSNGFDVLPSGSLTDQPLEMLGSPRFDALIEQLSRQYDRVIIDSAPVEAVSDALSIARVADGVLYVVKSHETSARLAAAGLGKLAGMDALLIGVLLTQVDMQKLSSYGADHDYHGYYDYYDYAAPAAAASDRFNLERDELRHINLRPARPYKSARARLRARRTDVNVPGQARSSSNDTDDLEHTSSPSIHEAR